MGEGGEGLRRESRITGKMLMAARKPVEYHDASPAVRAVFDDIKKTPQRRRT